MVAIRRMDRRDLGEVADIWNAVIRDTSVTFTTEEKREDALAAWLAEDGPRLVAAEGPGAVLGFAAASPFRSGPGYRFTWEHSVHVAPPGRGRGLGRALMDALAAELRARGGRAMIAGISGENPRAEAFHRRLGFGEVGRIPEAGFKFGRWMDLVLMRRAL
ncbi:MAG: N-acetyltransferase family protein [Pseudomonadota bacterium]